ncbi:TonB-dependent receptor [Sphingopyxis sp. MG]|uniref:TonB-dependent receptor n=1 Tax=Sphingopyxis sp. MG TaxID=1866325 RepID=UPI001319F0EA|nr:TonB-dependent receptor [Sphingopyxis sp. MG]
MKKFMTGLLLAGTALPAMAAEPQPAEGAAATKPNSIQADGGNSPMGDIVVTAQKRSENIQRVPIAITALSGDALRDRQVTSVADLTTIAPSVNFGTYGGAARIAIRGIGFDAINPGSEARIAYHIDGVYVSRPGAQLGSFFDVERVEVLRGPQGTLYGRNATGGSINVISRQPTDSLAGYADLTVGNYGAVSLQAAVSGPLAEGVQARLAVVSNNRSGYGTNLYTGTDIDDANQRGARATIRIEPTSRLSVTLTGDFYRESDNSYGIHYFDLYNPGTTLPGVALGGTPAGDLRDINSDRDPTNDKQVYGFSGTISYDLDQITIKSLTGYRHSRYEFISDLDQTEIPLNYYINAERSRQISQELQLSGKIGETDWLVGGYYFDEKIYASTQATRNLMISGGPDFMTNGFVVAGDTHVKAVAVFGQLDLAVTDSLKIIAGARYNRENISIDDIFQLDFARAYDPNASLIPLPGFPRSARTRNTAFTPKLGVQFQATPDALFYATVSKGFKSGGFNLGVDRPAFAPEKLWAYEGGIKVTALDRAIRANLAGFYYDYSNLQVSKVINSTVVTENAASAVLYGGELELTVLPTDALQFDGSLSYLHSRYKDFQSLDPGRPALGEQDLDGKRLTQAPRVTINAGAQYRFDLGSGSLTARGEMNYTSRVYFTAFNDPRVGQAGNVKANAFLTYRPDGQSWIASVFVRNITDKVTRANGLVGSAVYGSPVNGSVSPPRTFGAQFRYEF